MRKDTKALRRAALMPPLHLALPDQEFDIDKSEVINWLCSQPELRNALFTFCRNSGAIVFDKATGKWRGKDYGMVDHNA